MADLYASAVGTTVMQLKEIPKRDATYDGYVCIFGLKVDEEWLLATLRSFGEITSVDLTSDPPTVRLLYGRRRDVAMACG